MILSPSQAAQVSSTLSDMKGNTLGTVSFEDSEHGLLIKPQLKGLPAGLHGFHVHEHSNCEDAGMKAGGHLDPKKTNSHQGPYAKGHLGDLPVLFVNAQGESNTVLLAPRLKVDDLQGHAVMIHESGDNYTDKPTMGGGGARIGCGKIPS